MAAAARAKAAAAGAGNVRPVVSSAETLHAEQGYFELAVIGNAFHRLDRDLVTARVLGWLQPGGHLALCWSSAPWDGEQDWQRTLAAALDEWKAVPGNRAAAFHTDLAAGLGPHGCDLTFARR
jgi:Methyltransferase domain